MKWGIISKTLLFYESQEVRRRPCACWRHSDTAWWGEFFWVKAPALRSRSQPRFRLVCGDCGSCGPPSDCLVVLTSALFLLCLRLTNLADFVTRRPPIGSATGWHLRGRRCPTGLACRVTA